MDAATTADEQLVAELRVRLKPSRGAAPKREHILAAIALARDPGARPVSVYEAFGVPAGGARSRVIEYRDRILRDGITMETKRQELGSGDGGGSAVATSVAAGNEEPMLIEPPTQPTQPLDDSCDVDLEVLQSLDEQRQLKLESQRARQARYAYRKKFAMHKSWEELSDRERAAAAVFGFKERFMWTDRYQGVLTVRRNRWRRTNDLRDVSHIFVSRAWYRAWADLKDNQRTAAAALGYGKTTWDTQRVRCAKSPAGDFARYETDDPEMYSDWCSDDCYPSEPDSDSDRLSWASSEGLRPCATSEERSGKWNGEDLKLVPTPNDPKYPYDRSADCMDLLHQPNSHSEYFFSQRGRVVYDFSEPLPGSIRMPDAKPYHRFRRSISWV